MNNKRSIAPILLLPLLLFFFSCNLNTSQQQEISSDSTVIALGDSLFTQHCSSCHNIQQNGIGPKLAGVTREVSPAWLHHFISNPEQVIKSGDERANKLYGQYKTLMPPFNVLNEKNIDAIIAYIHAQQPSASKTVAKGIADPIRKPVKFDGLTVSLKEITTFPATSDNGRSPLARITKLDYQPGPGTIFVNDLNGKLYALKNGKPELYMDIAKLKAKFIHKPGLATGFGSFAFHPNFAKNGFLYTTHTEPPRTEKATFGYPDSIKATVQWVLTEWKVKDPAAEIFEGSGRELFRVDMVSGIHGVQEITFNPLAKPGDEDFGLLYIGVGDGGCVENGFPSLALSKETVWGTILRIDPLGHNSANGNYGIPSHNPYSGVQHGGVAPEIYASGFRNPHRITWTKRGEMLACNIGQHHIESVNLITPGRDYGWPTREGRFVIDPLGDINNVYPLPADDSIYEFTYPVAAFDHDEGAAITGGFEYWGTTIPLLYGKYLFGDIPSGRLFHLNTADIEQGRLADINEWRITLNGVLTTLVEACGNGRVDLHFGRDAQGELYILTKADGKLYKITGAEQTKLQ